MAMMRSVPAFIRRGLPMTSFTTVSALNVSPAVRYRQALRARCWRMANWLAVGCWFLLLATPLCGQESDVRTWTDATGKFTIEAKLIGVENGKAKLEKPDGKILQIELEKLSKSDQAFVANLMGESPSGAGKPGAKKGKIDIDHITMVEVDRTPRWSMAVQPQPLATDWSTDPIPLSIPENGKPWENDTFADDDDSKSQNEEDVADDADEDDSDASGSSKRIWLPDTFSVGNQHSPNLLLYRRNFFMQWQGGMYRGVALDLKSGGEAVPFTAVPASEVGMAVDPTSTLMACLGQSQEGGRSGYRMHIFEMRGNRISKRSWMEIADTIGFGAFWRTPEVQFAGSSHVLVTTPFEYDGLTGCCDLGEAKMNWAVNHPWGVRPLVTPDEKSIIISFDGGIASFDRSTGEQTGWIETGRTSFEALCLTPDGQRLVASSTDRIAVFRIGDGELESCFGIYTPRTTISINGRVRVYPVSNHRVATLIHNGHSLTNVVLSDLDARCTVCSYSFPSDANCVIDGMGKLRYLDTDGTQVLWRCMSLPHEDVAQEVEAAMNKIASISMPASIAVDGRYNLRLITYFNPATDANRAKRAKYRYEEPVDYTSDVLGWLEDHGLNPDGSGSYVFRLEESNDPPPIMDEMGPAGRGNNRIRPPASGNSSSNMTGIPETGSRRSRQSRPEDKRPQLMPSLPDDAEITGHGYSHPNRIGTLYAGGIPIWAPVHRYRVSPRLQLYRNTTASHKSKVDRIVEDVLSELDVPLEIRYAEEQFHFMVTGIDELEFLRGSSSTPD